MQTRETGPNLSNSTWLQAFLENQKTAMRANTLVIALMMACLGGTIAQLGARIDPAWNSSYLVWACFLVALEGMLTQHVRHAFHAREKIGFRVAEWFGLLLAFKLAPYLANGFSTFSSDLQSWQANPLAFFSSEYVALIGLGALVWRLSGDFGEDLEALNADITDLSYEEGKQDNSRSEARQRLLDRALALSVSLALITVATRLEVDFLWGERPLGPSTMLYLVCYFILTLVLLSQSQFALLRGQWLWHKVSMSPGLAGKWLQYAIIFILVLTLIALLLPTSYTLGFLDSIKTVLDFIWSAALALFTLLTFPFRWLLSLFTGSEVVVDPAPQPEEVETIPQPIPDSTLPWLEVLKSILFWAVILGLVGYALWFYIRRSPQLGRWLGSLRITSWLGSAWLWLRGLFSGAAKAAGSVMRSIAKALQARTPGRQRIPGTRFSFKQATPRQQVIYFYLQLLEKASARGLVRKPSQTPAQFEQTLIAALREVEPEVHGMTGAFHEARYSRHAVEDEQTSLVRRMWTRIMQAFRQKGKAG